MLRDGKGFKNLISLGVASFLTDLSSEMVFGILPVFVVVELKASRTLLGIMEGLAEFLSYSLRVVSGIFTDLLGKRKVLVISGYSLSSLMKPFFAVASTWEHAITFRALERVGKGIRTSPRDVLLSSSVPTPYLGKAFGFHKAMDQSGAIIGPILALVLLPLVGYRGIFLYSLVPGLLAVAIVILFTREVGAPPGRRRLLEGARRLTTGPFLAFLLVMGIFHLAAYNFSFVLLKARAMEVEDGMIPLVYMAINVAHTGIAYPAGALSDRLSKPLILTGGLALFAATSLISALSPTGVWLAFVVAIIYGGYLGIAQTVPRAMIPELSAPDLRGTAYGVYYFMTGGSMLVANVAFGALWDYLGAPIAFTYSMLVSTMAVALAIAFRKRFVPKTISGSIP